MAPPSPFGVIVTMAENETHVEITVERYREKGEALDASPVTAVKVDRKAFHAGRIPEAIARGLGECVCHTLAALSEKT